MPNQVPELKSPGLPQGRPVSEEKERASTFLRGHFALCEKYQVEVWRNHEGVPCVLLDEGMHYPFRALIPGADEQDGVGERLSETIRYAAI
jgi:hypothetical protein